MMARHNSERKQTPIMKKVTKAAKPTKSFSTQSVICWSADAKAKEYLYEERITLWNARNIDEAIKLGEAETKKYAKQNGYKYTGYIMAFAMEDKVSAEGVEVFSLLRDSDLSPSDYLDRFHDTGTEHSTLTK